MGKETLRADRGTDLLRVSNRRSMLCNESPVHGDEDFDLLEELASKADDARHPYYVVPPLSLKERYSLLLGVLEVGRIGVIKRIERIQQRLRWMSDGGRSFEIALVSSQASPKHAELSCARLVLAPEMFGFKGDWMARDYLESGYSQRTSSNSFQQVYGFWSKKHIYEQLAKGNKDMKHDYSCFGKWEQDMASCIHFGPASVVFSPDRKLPSRDIRPWVEAFIELSLPSLVHGCGQFGMVTDRRLMRLQVFAEMAARAGFESADKAEAAAVATTTDGSVQGQADDSVQPGSSAATAAATTIDGSVQGQADDSVQSGSSAATATVSAISLGGNFVCDSCKASFENAKAVKKCSMCLTASYCSKECQTRDWKEGGHKARCKYLTTRGGLMAAVLKAAAVEEVK